MDSLINDYCFKLREGHLTDYQKLYAEQQERKAAKAAKVAEALQAGGASDSGLGNEM